MSRRTTRNAGNNLGTSASPNAYNGNDQATTVGGVTQSYLDLGNNLRVGGGTDTTLNGPLGVTSRTTSAGTTFYTRDTCGEILDEHGAAGTHYYLGDYQGSIAALIGSAGGIDGVYTYDTYARHAGKKMFMRIIHTFLVSSGPPIATFGLDITPCNKLDSFAVRLIHGHDRQRHG